MGEIIEIPNIAFLINDDIENQTWDSGLSSYTQANCQVTLTNDGYKIYRPPNLIYPDAGNTMWGGLRVQLFTNFYSQLLEGHKYRISFTVTGQSSNSTTGGGLYFTNQMGWGGGGLTNVGFSKAATLPSNFEGELKIVAETNVLDSIYKICTTSYSSFVAGTYYNCYRDLAFGFNYTSTGTLGTDIYITNFNVQDITELTSTNDNGIPLRISNQGVKVLELSEMGITDGMVGYWPLDNNANDLSSYNNPDSIIYGSPSYSSGIKGSSLYSPTYADYIRINDGYDPSGTTELTISAWFKIPAVSMGYDIRPIMFGNYEVLVYTTTSNKIRIYVHNGTAAMAISSTTSYIADTWFHFTGTYDGYTAKIYFDGNYEASVSTISGSIRTNGSYLLVGSINSSSFDHPIYIDEVRIYNRVLSAEEIGINYSFIKEKKLKMTNSTIYSRGIIEG